MVDGQEAMHEYVCGYGWMYREGRQMRSWSGMRVEGAAGGEAQCCLAGFVMAARWGGWRDD